MKQKDQISNTCPCHDQLLPTEVDITHYFLHTFEKRVRLYASRLYFLNLFVETILSGAEGRNLNSRPYFF